MALIVIVTVVGISIHAPRAGSDDWHAELDGQTQDISIHAPRAGSDAASPKSGLTAYSFQSTLPVRGATSTSIVRPYARFYFNPRSPCGERRLLRGLFGFVFFISIHAPRAGSDVFTSSFIRPTKEFQSTLPVRGATKGLDDREKIKSIFQSTLPVRGATGRWYSQSRNRTNFNPRSPCGERLPNCERRARRRDYFNPRSPCGERPPLSAIWHLLSLISIHAPRAGSDGDSRRKAGGLSQFQSTLPVRGATCLI